MRPPDGQEARTFYPGSHTAPQGKSRRIWVIAALGALCLAVLMLGLSSAGLFRGSDEIPSSVVIRRDESPVLKRGAEEPVSMPAHIREWLEHLRRIEERKNQLHRRQVAEMRVFMTKFSVLGGAAGLLSEDPEDDNTNPIVPAQEQLGDLPGPWNSLITQYQSVPPPVECRELADTYLRAISEVPAMMADVQEILTGVASGEAEAATRALEALYSMQDTSARSVDEYFAESDDQLAQICDRYNTRKWFSISPDMGGGMFTRPGP